jgi:superfamily II DNA/RNA helicase
MSKQQTAVHNAAQNALPPITLWRMKRGLPPNKQDLAQINKFQSQSRQASVSLRNFTKDGVPEPTPKVLAAAQSLVKNIEKNPEHKALVYSNYLSSLDDYESEMKRLGIPTARIQGGQKQTDRKQIVEDFNSGKVKALLVSSAGGEGFDLKGTRQVQVLEPHWNDEKINQVIGRAVRHQSHSHLPEEDRKVTVERYIAAPRSIFGTKKRGVEDYLQDMSDYKTLLNNQVIDLMVKKAVDKEAAKWREMVRAGTLSQKEILRLRRAGLLDYGKEIAGLERGTDAILKRFGVKQIYHGKKKPPSLESGLAESMGTALHGDTGKLHVYPRQEVLEPVRSQHRAMMAVVRRHEADEARALHRITGTITPQSPEHIAKVGPVKMMEDRFRENFFFHASPEVIMREQRNAALMPKPMQEAWTKVRSGRGDYEAARELLGGTDLTRANIKKARRHYAQMGSGAQAKFQEKHMQAAGYEV